jgi:hypothetical protein
MFTIFTVPKRFTGHIGLIQRNAIQSWLRLRPACEIILCGNSPDVADVAMEFGVGHLADIRCNSFGTPLLDSVFGSVARTARNRLLCYANADIILLDEFLGAVRAIALARFLMVGQRWDCDIRQALDFSNPSWREHLEEHVARHGELHPPAGSDYFVFPRGHGIEQLPPFAVGRQAWDNWMIYNARRRRIPVIDATAFTTVIHQNHDYAHIPRGDGLSYQGIESQQNVELLGSAYNTYTLLDVTHLLGPAGLRRASDRKYRIRRRAEFFRKYIDWWLPTISWRRMYCHVYYHRYWYSPRRGLRRLRHRCAMLYRLFMAHRPRTGLLRLYQFCKRQLSSAGVSPSARPPQRANKETLPGPSDARPPLRRAG